MSSIKVLWVDNEFKARVDFYIGVYYLYKKEIEDFFSENLSRIKVEVSFEHLPPQVITRKIIYIFQRCNYTQCKDKSSAIAEFYRRIHELIGFEIIFANSLKEEHLNSTDYQLIVSDDINAAEGGENVSDFLIKNKEKVNIPIVIYSAGKLPRQVKNLQEAIPEYFYAWYFKDSSSLKGLIEAIQKCKKGGKVKKEYFINQNPNLILHLFFPLDIDMQALEMICNDEKLSEDNKIKKIRDYLTDNETGMLKDAT